MLLLQCRIQHTAQQTGLLISPAEQQTTPDPLLPCLWLCIALQLGLSDSSYPVAPLPPLLLTSGPEFSSARNR